MIKQRRNGEKTEVFDIIRKKWVLLTEEEKVRQWLIHRLVEEKKIPESHISVERKITVGNMTKRYDLVIYNNVGTIEMVIECKAPTISLTQEVISQVGNYNKTLQAPIIGVCNGKEQLFFNIHFQTGAIQFLHNFSI